MGADTETDRLYYMRRGFPCQGDMNDTGYGYHGIAALNEFFHRKTSIPGWVGVFTAVYMIVRRGVLGQPKRSGWLGQSHQILRRNLLF